MSQGDCVRVQIAQFEIQKAARKGLLPLDLGRLVAVLSEPQGPLPFPLTEDERLLIAMHLETCDGCRAFWDEQLKLGSLLGDAAFDLPPQATQLETARLAERVLELTSSSQSAKPRETAKFQDYLTQKREVRVSSKFQTKKLALVAAGAFIVVLGVVYFSLFYPPVAKEDVQGAIGKRDVYRETNMTAKDVTANSGPGGASFAGLVEFLKSPEFKALTNNSNYQGLVHNQAAFSQLINNDSFHAFCNQVQNNQANALVNSIVVFTQSGLSQNNNFQQLFQNQQFQQAVANSSNFQQLQQNSALVSNSNFQQLVHNNQFNQLMNGALYSFIHQNANALSDFASMINNSAFQQLAHNASGMESMLQNNAFNSLINNQSAQLFYLVSGLQQNNAFQSLIVDANFTALVNSSEFQALAGNSSFQQLLQDSNFHQVVMSQEQGSLLNNNQFNQLINSSQYQSLASNNNFQSLIHNNNFNGLVNSNQFHNLITNNVFALFLGNSLLPSYANATNGMQTLLQQSHELSIVIPQSQEHGIVVPQ